MNQEPTSPITLKDVAQYAQVSTSTVSRVLNNKGEISEDTRLKVFEAIHALGYRPSLVAQGLRTKASHLIGLLLPEILSPFFAEFAMGVELEASEAGYTVTHSNTLYLRDREESGLHYMLDRYVDGVIYYSPLLEEHEFLPMLTQIGASVVINLPVSDPTIGGLNVNNYQGMHLIIRHLVELGHKNIAYFALSSSWNGRERAKAFIQALNQAGLAFDSRRIFDPDSVANQNPQPPKAMDYSTIPQSAVEDGEKGGLHFLDVFPEVDAIIGFNDLCAVGILRALVSAGKRVPQDVAVVGFDNALIGSKFVPSITSASINTLEVGKQAARMLIDHLENQVQLEKISLPFRLFPRQSTLR